MTIFRRGLHAFMLLAAIPALHAAQGARPMPTVRQTGPSVVMQNAVCRYAIGTNGVSVSFGPADGKLNLCEPDQPFMVVCAGDHQTPSSKVALAGPIATVEFGATGIVAKVRLEAKPDYFALQVTEITGPPIQWLQLCNLRLKITQSVGTLVNAAWDDAYGACVMAANEQVEATGEDGSKAVLVARCYPEYGLVGARAVIIGVPTGKTDPGAKVLAAIGKMEVAEGLPHPLVKGVWLKQSPERFRSYLMVHDLGEANADAVIAAAKGGFGCIEFYPWRSTPAYELNPGLFPHGLDGLKQVADKIHAAGMQVGLHCMQSMVGWGPKDDRYISPKADPRLLQDPRGKLAAAIDEKATTIAVEGGTKGWPDRGDLYLEGEIIQYEQRTEAGFENVKRGLYGTTVTAHAAGAGIGLLVNCFPIWGYTVYCPDLKTDLDEEICQRLADVFNAAGADMSYFDGGEELIKQPPYWRNGGTVALGVMKRLTEPVVLEGNALYTNLSWHVITRGSPHFDPITFGRREYTLRFKGTNPQNWAKNLLTGDVGWFAPHLRTPASDAVTPDEVMLLCLKAVGGKAPISFSISATALDNNPRMPEMLEIIRACDELKRKDYFSPTAIAELTRPRAECHLEQTPGGEWSLRPMQFGPSQVVNAAQPESGTWQYQNPYSAQQPFVRVRARAKLAPYGDAANIALADPAKGDAFQPEATASADLVQTVETATEKAPDGTSAFLYRAQNNGKAVSQWAKISHKLAGPVDLTQHRRLGLWVKGNGSGGLLNVQLTGRDTRRDHYLPLDFTGWRLVELLAPEEGARFWDLTWPYSWTDLFYTAWSIYTATDEIDLYVNALPAGATAECLVGRIEALQETAAPLQSPSLEANGQKLTFPATLQPEEYLELDWAGRCRHFDPNGKLLETVTPQGKLQLAAGANQVRFGCTAEGDNSTRAEVTLAVRGTALQNAKRAGLKEKTARYEGLMDTKAGG